PRGAGTRAGAGGPSWAPRSGRRRSRTPISPSARGVCTRPTGSATRPAELICGSNVRPPSGRRRTPPAKALVPIFGGLVGQAVGRRARDGDVGAAGNLEKVHGVRDHAPAVELILDIGLALIGADEQVFEGVVIVSLPRARFGQDGHDPAGARGAEANLDRTGALPAEPAGVVAETHPVRLR